MPADLKEQLAAKIAGLAPAARRAIYEQARAVLQSEVRAAAPFMPVQTVVARRRELEDAILAVEKEAAHWGPSWSLVSAPFTPPEALAPVPPPAKNEGAPKAAAPEVVPAARADAQLADASPQIAAAPALAPPEEIATETDEYLESAPISPPAGIGRTLALYSVIVAAALVSIAYAATTLGIGFGGLRERTPAPAAAVPAAPLSPDPAQALIKGAGFQVAAQQAFNAANAHLARDELDRAIAAFDDAIRFDASAAAYAGRALAYWKIGNTPAAIRDYSAAIEREPANVANRFSRAVAYNRQGEYQRAIDDLDRVIAAEPANINALSSRCRARAILAHLQEALTDCNEVLKARPADAGALDRRGFVYLRLGRLDRAIADYNEVLKADPKHAGALYGRGLSKIGRGDRAGGNEDVTAARAIDPEIVATFARYGVR